MSQLLTQPQAGVCFDPDAICLMGIYRDEIAVFRARRRWSQILEAFFALKSEEDYCFETRALIDSNEFRLVCRFNSPCGRYAFWRLTNAQAPEAQYEIETAHIPDSPSKNIEMVLAPDLQNILESPLVLHGLPAHVEYKKNKSLIGLLASVVKRVLNFRNK
jgi:hypothetical protein